MLKMKSICIALMLVIAALASATVEGVKSNGLTCCAHLKPETSVSNLPCSNCCHENRFKYSSFDTGYCTCDNKRSG